jgi:hypothetical protein
MLQRVGVIFVLVGAASVCQAAGEDDLPGWKMQIVARKNPGNVRYRSFINAQQRLDSYLAPEPRLVEWYYRVSFTELPRKERDNYEPQSWAVSIVGDTVDETVPVSRGGYFLLPVNTTAYKEDATIMFREQTRKLSLDMVWALRVGQDQRISYADLGKAMEELKGVQSRIPASELGLRVPKNVVVNGLQACFRDSSGRVRVADKDLRTTRYGNCYGVEYDPARAAAGDSIEFSGPLEVVALAKIQ